MIDNSSTIYYLVYFIGCLLLLVGYIRSKSQEGTVITTKEFQRFQWSFLIGYSGVLLSELIANASFYHTLVSIHCSPEQITKLFLATVTASAIGSVLLEVFDLGSRRDKCALCTLFYCVSMFSIFFGGHFEMLLMGRILYGFGQALQGSSFESFAIHQHSSQGFPEDWLVQTFSLLSHAMALIAALTGVVGQFVASLGPYGCVTFCTIMFAVSTLFIMIFWEKDVNSPRFLLSGFLFNLNQTISAVNSNKSILYFLCISSLCETCIIIFTFYWAPFFTLLFKDVVSFLPYEIIFSSMMICSMLGNYFFQYYISSGVTSSQIIQLFQIVLMVFSASFFLGGMMQTAFISFLVVLIVQACVGVYWPCMGYFRGKLIPPEMKNCALILPKVVSMLLTYLLLNSAHESPFLILTSCAGLTGLAFYLQNNQNELLALSMDATNNIDDDDEDVI